MDQPLTNTKDTDKEPALYAEETVDDDGKDSPWENVGMPLDSDDVEPSMEEIFGDTSMDGEADDHDAMVMALQTLGVDAVEATRFVSSMFKKPTTFFEVYGRGSLSQQAQQQRRNLNVKGLAAMDLRTSKPDGKPWDFTLKSDQQLALDMQKSLKPDWLVGSPPCTDWSSWNIGINHKKMPPEEVQRRMKNARVHLKFVVKLYRIQLAEGRHFLHEHPAGARSWVEPYMVKLMQVPGVDSVVSHQCEYGLMSPDANGVLQLVKKPTRWLSSSPAMLRRLSRRCSCKHVHQQLLVRVVLAFPVQGSEHLVEFTV